MVRLGRSRAVLRSKARDEFTIPAVSGLIAGAAYAAVQEADIRWTVRNVDDLAALGRLVINDHGRARALGLGMHFVNSVALALVYVRVRGTLPGPPWLRGTLFALAENALLYPVTIFEEKHPAIAARTLDRYWTWPAFLQSIPRHILYGAVLGALDHRLRTRTR